jgi:CRISPR-associated endonuclease/helicase Cas3
MSTFSQLPPFVRHLWAKSGDFSGHGLLAHLLDVAAVTETILSMEPAATRSMAGRALGVLESHVPRWVAALAGLHDLGKAIPGFQAKWPPGQRIDEAAGLRFEPARALHCDQHSLATAALLTPMLERVCGAPWMWCQHVVQAVSAHHGYHFTTTQVNSGAPLREPEEWQRARDALLAAYWVVLAPTGVPSADECSLPIVNWLAGLTSAADWIASNPDWFPLGERHDDLAAYHRHAMGLAEQALARIGWRRWWPLLKTPEDVDALLPRLIGRDGELPRPLQRAAGQLLSGSKGPVLLVVEAPMGEGKTELAFMAHLHLQAANQHRGLYIALPTQATGNAMFRRTAAFLERFAPGPLDLQLVHGGAAMSEDLAALRGVGDSAADTLSASEWFGQRNRPLLSSYGVGTMDQALYAVLNVKHHFVRLWGLSNRVVVLDEVHAYDTYTSGLIVSLLRWLKALGCSVVLMSATLPRARCRELLKAWGLHEAPPAQPYPRLTLADEAGVRGEHAAARPLAPIELRGLGSEIEAMAEIAVAHLRDGGCGALIVNTVSRAQALYRALRTRLIEQGLLEGTELVLFHARFPADDRQRLEERVRTLFGTQEKRPWRALMVATQVAEQSLDIDFDFMVSDLAPVDLLLQRAGRLHRHQRNARPVAHATPRLWVAGLRQDELPELKRTAWGFVYDAYILGRTWALLKNETLLRLPQDIDRLVQWVYDSQQELPDGLEAAVWKRIEIDQLGDYRSKVRDQQQRAATIAIDPSDEAHRVYDGKPRGHEEDEHGLGLTNSTRLGPPSITLVPVRVGSDGRWYVHDGEAGFDPVRPVDAATARALYNRQIKVSHRSVVKHFEGREAPAAFAEHPLLRHMQALCLHQGVAVDPGLRVFLDVELGLVNGSEGGASPPPSAAPQARGTLPADHIATQSTGSSPPGGAT